MRQLEQQTVSPLPSTSPVERGQLANVQLRFLALGLRIDAQTLMAPKKLRPVRRVTQRGPTARIIPAADNQQITRILRDTAQFLEVLP